jgi:hypothetical protein
MKAVDHPDDFGHATRRHFEHGQEWLTCLCGATWSVVICSDGSPEPPDEEDDAPVDGPYEPLGGEWEDYERIDEGDGECEREQDDESE